MNNKIFKKDATAQGVAKQRCIESLAKPNKRVIYDPYAKYFVLGASIIKLMGHKFSVWITKNFAPGFHEHLISRTRFIDDFIEKTTINNAEQYVILGAGYDTRAHRLSLPSSLKIFEVDQAEVQNIKRAKLPENIPNRSNVNYVSLDFNLQSLKQQLLEAGFNINKSTVFTLEGVSQYISKEALKNTLKEIAELTSNSNATFYMSYVNKQLKENPIKCFGKGYPNPIKKAKQIQYLSAKFGEPWISFFTEKEISSILKEYHFSVIENKTLADLNPLYFAPLGRGLAENEILNLENSVIATRIH